MHSLICRLWEIYQWWYAYKGNFGETGICTEQTWLTEFWGDYKRNVPANIDILRLISCIDLNTHSDKEMKNYVKYI